MRTDAAPVACVAPGARRRALGRAGRAVLAAGALAALVTSCGRGRTATPAPVPAAPDTASRARVPEDPGRAVVRGDVGAAWPALLAAYAELSIPVATRDDAARRVASGEWRGHRAVGRLALRAAVDCGSDRMGPRADSYEVVLVVESRVVPGDSAGTSVVTTTVRGTGSPVSFRGPSVACTSAGGIERALHGAVAGRLAQPGRAAAP